MYRQETQTTEVTFLGFRVSDNSNAKKAQLLFLSHTRWCTSRSTKDVQTQFLADVQSAKPAWAQPPTLENYPSLVDVHSVH